MTQPVSAWTHVGNVVAWLDAHNGTNDPEAVFTAVIRRRAARLEGLLTATSAVEG
ncbi:hypothetical protein [Streptomyces sp. NPDC003077]|uniref:hypothetical protein n=1 Tax=Streptomyces sp. NPDC003077 TaxID=3154443 RepID=UPI0033BA20AC